MGGTAPRVLGKGSTYVSVLLSLIGLCHGPLGAYIGDPFPFDEYTSIIEVSPIEYTTPSEISFNLRSQYRGKFCYLILLI